MARNDVDELTDPERMLAQTAHEAVRAIDSDSKDEMQVERTHVEPRRTEREREVRCHANTGQTSDRGWALGPRRSLWCNARKLGGIYGPDRAGPSSEVAQRGCSGVLSQRKEARAAQVPEPVW